MRTGSNLLESKPDMFVDLETFGEAFNPSFIGSPKTRRIIDVQLEECIQNPMLLLEKFEQQFDTISEFRYFHDHDLRVLLSCLLHPHCGLIILMHNPVESYISRKNWLRPGSGSCRTSFGKGGLTKFTLMRRNLMKTLTEGRILSFMQRPVCRFQNRQLFIWPMKTCKIRR